MLKRIIVICICLCAFTSTSQDYSALWNGHFSYFNISKAVSGSQGNIYAASENAVFSYDAQTNHIEQITTVNGLSGDDISTIHYSVNYQLLLIGYTNGLMEVVLDDNDDVLTVVDISNKATIPSTNKRINHFYETENLVYVSTGFGVSVFNLENLEFGDTFIIGNSGTQVAVSQTTVYGGAIYAACSDGQGIKKGDVANGNLIDSDNWQNISGSSFKGITSVGANLYALRTDNRIFQITNDVLAETIRYSDSVNEITSKDDVLLVTLNNSVIVYTPDFNVIGQFDITEAYDTEYTSATSDGEFVYVGTKNFGVLKTNISNPVNIEEIHPDGPLLNTPFSVKSVNNNLWVAFGEYTIQLDPRPRNNRGFSTLQNGTWTNVPYSEVFEAKNLNSIAVNPFNNNQAFISSFGNGLLEVNNAIPTFLYNAENSPLESLISPRNPNFIDVRLGHSEFDENGLLWTITSLIARPLKSYNPTNEEWRHYDFSALIKDALNDNVGFYNFSRAADGTFFIATRSLGVIGFNPDNNNIKNISEEDVDIPTNVVKAVAVDKREQLWIGTAKGLRVLFNPSSFFSEEVNVDNIVIEEDGVASELLFEQFISDIVVDGSNNKWISTFDSGLFYLSSDGQQTIFHFTKDNSPLPSNTVIDIDIDESNGQVYIATQKGLVSFRTGSSSPTEGFTNAHAYPNPVRPGFDIVEEKVKITDLPDNVNIKITDIEGNLVAEAQSRINQRFNGYNLEIDGGTAFWNGKNLANNVVASGVYLIMLADLDSFETKVVKLMVVR